MVGRGFLRYWVLRLLSEGPRTGYALAKELEKRLGWRPSPGSLYPLLAALAEQGLIAQGQGPRPRWSLTPKGAEALADLEKGKEHWKPLALVLAQAPSKIPGFVRFLHLFGQALAAGKAAELEELLSQFNERLARLEGGEGHGSPGC